MTLRSPLGVALGSGTAGDGVNHWWSQRVSALALVPLTVWLLVSLLRLPLADYAAVTIWMGSGWNPVGLMLTVLAACWHSRLGVQVVIEDYLHLPGLKLAALLGNSAAHVLLVASGLYAILRVALRGVP